MIADPSKRTKRNGSYFVGPFKVYSKLLLPVKYLESQGRYFNSKEYWLYSIQCKYTVLKYTVYKSTV